MHTIKKTRPINLIILFFLIVGLPSTLNAKASDSKKSIFDIINYQEVVEVKLSFNFDSLLYDRRNIKKVKGTFSFQDSQGLEQKWKVQLNVRGIFRRFKCEEMPPLRIDFSKKALAKRGLSKFDDMKLVSLCKDNAKADNNYLLKEYLCYKIYNELTPTSFRVQLLQISYEDKKSGEIRKQYAFLIEDFAQMRSRLNLKKTNKRFIANTGKFSERERKIVDLFQYMIGNVDYSVNMGKNVKLAVKEKKFVLIPYDFDFAALVSPSYAARDEFYGQESFSDRIYLGPEKKQEALANTIQYFNSKKEKILQIIADFELLPKRERKKMEKYCLSFFENNDSINIWNEE